MAISSTSGGEREPRGQWLTEQIEEYKKKHGVDDEAEPTEEEIKMQLKLPTKEKVDNNDFKEPLTNWLPVENTGIPGWRKELLPEEEVMRPPDWKPPTPPRVDISLQVYKDEFREESPKLPKITEIIQDKEKLLRDERDLDENDEVVLFNNSCIIRTTKAGIKKSKRDREDEDEEEEREFRGGRGGGGGRGGFGDRGRGGRGGGGRGGGCNEGGRGGRGGVSCRSGGDGGLGGGSNIHQY